MNSYSHTRAENRRPEQSSYLIQTKKERENSVETFFLSLSSLIPPWFIHRLLHCRPFLLSTPPPSIPLPSRLLLLLLFFFFLEGQRHNMAEAPETEEEARQGKESFRQRAIHHPFHHFSSHLLPIPLFFSLASFR